MGLSQSLIAIFADDTRCLLGSTVSQPSACLLHVLNYLLELEPQLGPIANGWRDIHCTVDCRARAQPNVDWHSCYKPNADCRTVHDWTIRPPINACYGSSEVILIGGMSEKYSGFYSLTNYCIWDSRQTDVILHLNKITVNQGSILSNKTVAQWYYGMPVQD